ncbi:TraB/GumN family protein [Altererythrobacter sp. GH1-8]|uniref:TraB/GumN family protein n=1 Tax=Altererythrobacter sp. GH1-8 TaxID=3349333 RepID=UPI00374D4098
MTLTRIAKSCLSATALSALLLASPVLADDHADIDAAPAAAEAPDGPALWSVADEDTTIYLFGTIHALPQEVVWMDEDITSALTASDTLVTEVNLAEMAGPKMIQIIQSTALLPPGTTLRSLFNAEQTQTFEAAMQQLQVPTQAFDQFEPWYAALMMTMLPLMQQGYSPDSGVEEVLIKAAGEIEKDALETIEFQLGLFDQLPQDKQVEFLIEAAENVDEIKPQLDAMVTEWLEGDADGLAKLMNESLNDDALAESVLFHRNRNWAEWIENRLDSPGTVFIAVGAGHLAGEKSVQDYLQQRGLTVNRVQ